MKLRRKEDSDKIVKLTNALAEREREIIELQAKVLKFESGSFGLRDALNDIKSIKAKHSLAEKQLDEYSKTINDLEMQNADFIEENAALRGELGKEFTSLDVSNFKKLKIVELEQSKSLILTLKGEIDKLEEERIALKAKLRLKALDRGERAIELGLDAEDLMQIEEYAEKLRSGEIPIENRID